MKLPSEIAVTIPNITKPMKIKGFSIVLIDSEKNKTVTAQIQLPPFLKPMMLWEGEAYDAAGDYTQAAAEARILELLGNDIPKSMVDLLYVRLNHPKK
jgi:hypothetical protein